MPEHVNQWLPAYVDGELSPQRTRIVEAHLEGCEVCRHELAALRSLSGALQAAKPEVGDLSAEQFTSQVILQLPRQSPAQENRTLSGLIWWLVPGVLLFAWLFIQTLIVTTGMVRSADQLGMLGELSRFLASGNNSSMWIPRIVDLFNHGQGQTGITFFEVISGIEWLTRILASQIIWQSILLLLYWSWMAIWFVRRQREPLKV